MPRVSILMPCRDAAAWLHEAVASLEAQTFADYEVVAVDDASTDGTPVLLGAWARRDPRVRIVPGPGRGVAAALAAGLDHTRGEIVVRMDADDIAAPTRLERQLARLDADPGLAACGTRVRYFPDDVVRDGARRYERWVNALVDPGEIDRDIFVECPIPHPTLAVRREALLAVGGYRVLDGPEDYDLLLRLWAAGRRMAKVPDVLLLWREGAGRTSRNDPRYSPRAFRRLKVEFLIRTHLARRDPIVWGAGPVGKALARELLARGRRVLAFVDLDPRKVGQVIHGAPVVEPGDIGRFPDAFILAAVGQEGAREEIRSELRDRDRREGIDFRAVA